MPASVMESIVAGHGDRVVRSIALAAASIAASTAWPASSAATDESDVGPVVLEWRAPQECPDGPSVQAEVKKLLGGAFAPSDRTVHAVAEVVRTADGFHVDLKTELQGIPGRRSFDHDTCASLASAVALVVALAVNPERVAQGGGLPGGERPPPAPSPQAAASASGAIPAQATRGPPAQAETPPTPGPTTSSRPAGVWSATASAAATLGPAPVSLLGPRVGLGFERWPARAELVGMWAPERNSSGPDGTNSRFSLVSGGLRGCLSPWRRPLSLQGCLGGDVVWVSARGSGSGVVSETGHATWPQLVASVAVPWQVNRHFVVRADVDVGVPLSSGESFVIDSLVVHRVWAVVVTPSLGAGVAF